MHRFAVTTRYTPLRTTVRRLFDDDPVDLAARATQRAGNEPRAIHERAQLAARPDCYLAARHETA